MDEQRMTRNEWRTDLLKRFKTSSKSPAEVSRRLSVTGRIARLIGDDIGHDFDKCGETQRFYLMLQATMFLDDVIETDGTFPGLEDE